MNRGFLAVAALAAFLTLPAEVAASGGKILAGNSLTLNCDNGRSYPIRARAVSDAGELVTGTIQTGPRTTHHFRLFPMGTGYRYGGHGFWLDGVRGDATLYVGGREAACTVEQG